MGAFYQRWDGNPDGTVVILRLTLVLLVTGISF